MHVAGKIFLGLGAVLLVIGLVMSGSGIGSVRDAGDSLEDLGDFAIENTNSGTVNVTDEDGKGDLGFTFWIKGEYLDEDEDGKWDHCAATNITILSHPEISDEEFFGEDARELNGSFYYEVRDEYDGCDAVEENKDLDRADPEGLIKVGRACFGCYAGPMEFESNTEVWVTNDDYLIGKLVEGFFEGAGGIMGIMGGIGIICGGACFLLLGGVLAIVLKDPKEATQMQQPPSA